uniref:Dehydrogenase/reductase 2 n=1 Tax=Rhinolophus ferrumequinum TaxID=59479 RepID=A0A671DVS2_RHIFE
MLHDCIIALQSMLTYELSLSFCVCLSPLRRGAVILVSSISAYIPHALGAYNVSKTALLGLTRTLALELAPRGIRVNCLVPGIIETDFSKVWSLVIWSRPLPPEDCAGLVSFLCSPDASYITGENIVVAGFSSRL